MRNKLRLLAIVLLTTVSTYAQNKNKEQMEKRIINPWEWQNERNYVQAIEVTKSEGTLYVSGQTAIDANGISSKEDMRSQVAQALQNLELVIKEANYDCKNVVRLNIYTTSTEELFANFDIIQEWVVKHGMKQATTLLEVKSLFETLKVEFEATVVK